MAATKADDIDVIVTNEGTIFLFEPRTEAAREWVREHVQLEGWQWFGPAFCVEHRFALDLAQGMTDDGLVVQ